MKFVLVERNAARELVQDRALQSVEFGLGATLASVLGGEVAAAETLGSTAMVLHNEGIYLISGAPDREHCLIFDVERCPNIWQRKPEERLQIFQRTLRFAIKIWEGLRLSPSEYFIGETKAVLFPLNLSSSSQFRLTTERIKGKGTATGSHLFIFRCGTNEGGGPDEIPPLGSYNLAMTGLDTASARALDVVRERPGLQSGAPLEIVELTEDGQRLRLPVAMPFDNWRPFLSDVQAAFVYRSIVGPERLEGPAGTGKTLALMLRCIHTLRSARDEGRDHRAIFLTHSEATRRAIEERFSILDPDQFFSADPNSSPLSVTVTTLQDWCAKQLAQRLADVEFLDRDATESKVMQYLYVDEALDEVMEQDYPSHRPFLSESFKQYLENEDRSHITEMLQHEIAIMVKGRAGEDLDKYQKLPPLRYNLPLDSPGDRGFVYVVYSAYQRRLQDIGQFDTDDVVLSAMQQLDTPIWRRRRRREGYDSIFLDETHLFNLNELSILHYMSSDERAAPIVFSIDRSQAIGDRGLESGYLEEPMVRTRDDQMQKTTMRSVFRSSPDIVSLAFSITAGGATLFTNFDNPLFMAASAFSRDEERLAEYPMYHALPNDEAMVTEAFAVAERMATKLPGGRSGVALVAFSPELLARLEAAAKARNRPCEVLKRRGDIEVVNRARTTSRFVLAGPEYVGGLEFDGVVLVGVDKGRVPPTTERTSSEARHFLKFAAHNLLYVAVTRAKYQVVLLGTSERGPSELLENAIQRRLLAIDDS